MLCYENILSDLEIGRLYSHKELASRIQQLQLGLNKNVCHGHIHTLIRRGKLVREGYNAYALPKGIVKAEYYPNYSNEALNLIHTIADEYPQLQFTIFETVLLNDFLNHLIASNTIFVQVEKDSSIYVFRLLQELGYANLLYKPTQKDFSLYWSKGCIVVTDMISEAPLRLKAPHVLTLEKMLVDIYSDKLISSMYERAEFPSVMMQAKRRYHLDEAKMQRYARRRNKEANIKELLLNC